MCQMSRTHPAKTIIAAVMSELPIDPEDYQKGDDAQDGQYHHATAQAAMRLLCNLLVRLLRSSVFSESSKAAPSTSP